MENALDLLAFLDAGIICIQCRIYGIQKFIKGQRGYGKQIDHAYRIGFWLCQQGTQEASGSNHMVIPGLFPEIFQGI